MKLDSLGYIVYATFECSGLDNKWDDIDPLRIQYKKSGAPTKHLAYPPNNPIRFCQLWIFNELSYEFAICVSIFTNCYLITIYS